jgi:hypothetical protein
MALLDPVISYCERSSAALGDEPLNALSNIAFFIAAWMLWKLYLDSKSNDRPALMLVGLVGLVAVGSTVFHVVANRLTMIGDVVPIMAFTFAYLWIAQRRFLGLSAAWAGVNLALFAVMGWRLNFVTGMLRFNGSVAYFPCLAALVVIGLVLRRRGHVAATPVLTAALLFAASLFWRSVDLLLCDWFPVGTHFMWHLINGIVLYVLVKAVINPAPKS